MDEVLTVDGALKILGIAYVLASTLANTLPSEWKLTMLLARFSADVKKIGSFRPNLNVLLPFTLGFMLSCTAKAPVVVPLEVHCGEVPAEVATNLVQALLAPNAKEALQKLSARHGISVVTCAVEHFVTVAENSTEPQTPEKARAVQVAREALNLLGVKK